MSGKINPLVGSALGVLAGIIGSNIISDAAKSSLKDEVHRVHSSGPTSMDMTTDELISSIKHKAGLQDMPHGVYDNFENAMYVPPQAFNQNTKHKMMREAKRRMGSSDERVAQSGKFLSDLIRFSDSPDGGIAIGRKMSNPFIVGHEVGHAMIEKEDSIANFLQRNYNYTKNLGTVGAVGSGLAQLYGYMADNETAKKIGNIGALASVGALGLNALGRVYYESDASDKSIDLLDRMNIKPRDPQDYQRLKDRALDTYWASGPLDVALPAIGGIAGYHLMKNLSST